MAPPTLTRTISPQTDLGHLLVRDASPPRGLDLDDLLHVLLAVPLLRERLARGGSSSSTLLLQLLGLPGCLLARDPATC